MSDGPKNKIFEENLRSCKIISRKFISDNLNLNQDEINCLEKKLTR